MTKYNITVECDNTRVLDSICERSVFDNDQASTTAYEDKINVTYDVGYITCKTDIAITDNRKSNTSHAMDIRLSHDTKSYNAFVSDNTTKEAVEDMINEDETLWKRLHDQEYIFTTIKVESDVNPEIICRDIYESLMRHIRNMRAYERADIVICKGHTKNDSVSVECREHIKENIITIRSTKAAPFYPVFYLL